MNWHPFWSIRLLLVVFCAAGCTAQCRELEPESEVREDIHDRVDDQLDEADLEDAQRVKVQALFERAVPARMQFRKETVPLLHQLVVELQRDTPDRQKQGALLVQLVDAGERYGHVVTDVVLKAHGELNKAQRQKLAAHASKPSSAFDGSWFLDRGLDLLMMRIHASDAQAQLIDQMKAHFIVQARELQKRLDALRVQAAAELVKDKPDPALVHAKLKQARVECEGFVLKLAGYHQLLASKLQARQRAVLNAELVRIEACPEEPKPGA